MRLKKAMDDIRVAKLLLSQEGNPTNDEGLYDLAGYHIQQGIEKELKHVLHDCMGMDDTTRKFRTHDIVGLIDILEEEYPDNGMEIPEGLKRMASDITDWETQSRYGGNLILSRDEMNEAISYFDDLYSQIGKSHDEE